MQPLTVVSLDQDTLIDQNYHLDFPHQLILHPSTAAEQTAAHLAGADIVISNKVSITAEHMAANPQLKLIAVAATGYDHIDIQTAREQGIRVCNIPGYGNDSVAEHAFMLMMALMRQLPAYQRDVAAGLWASSPHAFYFGAPIRDLNGKTLGIFGRGGIGTALAQRAEAFGMRVIFGEHKHAAHIRPGYLKFEEVLSRADVISLHCPLNEDTRNMIGEAELKMMKPQAVLINAGRGGLVDEQALVAALKYGQLGGAGFDVLTEEPPRNGNPLLNTRLPNLILTPHMAWGSQEAMRRLFDMLNDNINAFVHGTARNIVV
ncbi:MAG: D-2-hydroxyacid dehydrogenase [Eikenella sp.]|nr:D-2-hydroxyacid dehydrogenase [Eikenella sp.]